MNDELANYTTRPLTFRATEPQLFRLYGAKGMLVEISMDDGSVKFGESYTLDETAKVFWRAIGAHRGATKPE